MKNVPQDPSWKIQVLVVEDDEDLQKIMKINLEHEGFEVIQALNGKECLRLVKEIVPDVVLLDLMMPEMDGFETCKRIKSIDSTRDIPVIVVSAKETIKDKLKCFTFQADDYMTKPYEYEELAARIYLHLNKATMVKEMRDLERLRATRDQATELSTKLAAAHVKIATQFNNLTKKAPNKYQDDLETLARDVKEMFLIVERLRTKNDPFYESPHLTKEPVEVSD